MPFSNFQFLASEDLAMCQRVFDQICADASLHPTSIDAEMLASTVLTVFQLEPSKTEAELLVSIRDRRNDFEKLTG
ncbi:hypothetical protein [Mesorhizobium sp. M0488]|uniref:hypothetical protein n=1 Tax=unclassified Mesorhizobium TaxID=325217 RepID=UPI003336AA2F